MKTLIKTLKGKISTALVIISGLCFTSNLNLKAQTDYKKAFEKVGIISADCKGLQLYPDQAGKLLSMEIAKLNLYNVIDKYDIQDKTGKDWIELNTCFTKSCLEEIGKKIDADVMITGAFEAYPNNILITIREIHLKDESKSRSFTKEFLKLPNSLNNMVEITLQEMYGLEKDENLVNKLTIPYDFNNIRNTPDKPRLNTSGPRMGIMIFTGESAEIMTGSKDKGGYDGLPVTFQFGYQFEQQYLNEGDFQALVEFVPSVSGLDQGMFIPSFSVLNGLRSNKKGWEFAFGPTVSLGKRAKGYFDANGEWHLSSDWDSNLGENPASIIDRPDSRGDIRLETGFVFACGRTFKSGDLNIPMNVWVKPTKRKLTFGASFGFNSARKGK